jgi:hypothetical protein
LSHGLIIVHDANPETRSRRVQVSIEARIGHMSDDRIHGYPTRGEIRATELPIPQMSGDENDAAPGADATLDEIPAIHSFEEIEDRRPIQ